MGVKELLRGNLEMSAEMSLGLVMDMKDAPLTAPTAKGGPHPLWVLGHMTLSEGRMVQEWLLGKENPAAAYDKMFDAGCEAVDDPAAYPSFDEVLAKWQEVRALTLTFMDECSEADLEKPGENVPEGFAQWFGTYGQCLLMCANHWWMHRGQVADARRMLDKEKMMM